MIKKQKKFEIFLFLALAGLIVFISLSFYYVRANIKSERSAIEKQAELEILSFKLAQASDYLTSEVQKFAVTLNPVHLRNYWTEVNVTRSREKVINRLKELNIPPAEFAYLNTAKNNSDDLVNIETRAMKLILRVYEVPEEQMEQSIREYQLTEDDEQLSNNQKVNLARELLYNRRYELEKKNIMEPIAVYEATMSARVHSETQNAREHTDLALTVLLFAIVCVMLFTVFVTRFMLLKIFFPLKMYLLHLEDTDKNAEELLLKSNMSELLKDALINRKENGERSV